jgi:hypothetical protein
MKDDFQKSINTIRNRGFKNTGNPSFRIFNNSLIIGIYKGNRLPSYIETPKESIIIDKKVNLVDGILYFKIDSTFSLLSENIAKIEDKTIVANKYFPLSTLISKNLTPSVYLANNIQKAPFLYNLNKSFVIDDFKIELIKVQLQENGITYSIIDSCHLQNDTN